MYTSALIYMIIGLTVFGCASVDLKDFYPFGELHGDTVLPRGENQCNSVIMKFPSQDCSNMIDTEFYISTNGVISTKQSFCSFSKGIPPFSLLNNFDSQMAVAPFLTLTSTAIFGTVQFRVTYDKDILKRVNSDISDTGLLSYNATNALIVTWIDMTFAAYSGDIDSTPKNSFQAIVTSDGYYCFAIFYYLKITWNQGDYTDPCTGDTNTGIGNNCPALTGSASNTVLTSPVGCGSNSFIMTNSSNVNRPGVWISRFDYCPKYKRVKMIEPAYQDMMGHRSLKVIIPESMNCSAEWRILLMVFQFLFFESNCHVSSTSHDVTELSCFGLPFAFDYGSPFPFLFECDSQIERLYFKFKAYLFLTPPVPEAYINVLNVSIVDYSVSIELKWNAPLIAQLNPGCETVNISMHIFNPKTRIWNDSILIMQSVNNSGGLKIKLVEPVAGLFFSEHLLLGVTGNVGSNVTNKNTIFSKMFIFDLTNFNLKRKVRSLRDTNILATVDMMGHRKLNISYRTKPGQDGLGCKFDNDNHIIPVTPAIASSDNQYVTCYVPFLYSYEYMSVSLVTGYPFEKKNDDIEFQRIGSNEKQSNIYITKAKFNDYLLNFVIDVLPSYPRLIVEQVDVSTELNGQFQVQIQFTWDPIEIPSEYPVLNSFIYQFDDEKNTWMKEMMVSPQDIPPNAGSVPVTLSQEAITVFFNYKVIFGLGYVQGDDNFVIFSKMYIPGMST